MTFSGIEARGYLHEVLLELIDSHARAFDVSPALVPIVLPVLARDTVQTFRTSFDSIDKLGLGGYVQALLEFEYLLAVLQPYLTNAPLPEHIVAITRVRGRDDADNARVSALALSDIKREMRHHLAHLATNAGINARVDEKLLKALMADAIAKARLQIKALAGMCNGSDDGIAPENDTTLKLDKGR